MVAKVYAFWRPTGGIVTIERDFGTFRLEDLPEPANQMLVFTSNADFILPHNSVGLQACLRNSGIAPSVRR